MTAPELFAFLCDDQNQEASPILRTWLAESRRFHAFAVENRAKIRKKLRTAATPEGLRSALLELDVARHLLADRRCAVEYERFGQGRVRSPDLTITYRTNTTVHVEVTQVQAPAGAAAGWEGKLIGLVCQKLGQMVPASPNVLVVAPEGGSMTTDDVAAAIKRLKERVEGRDADLLARIGIRDPAAFFKQFRWLSGIVTWAHGAKSLWLNPQAARPLPPGLARLLAS